MSKETSQIPFGESETRASVNLFLVDAATLLHRYGTPSHRLERVMAKVSRTLGVDGTFLYTPTALIISLREHGEEKTFMRRVDSGTIQVDKLIGFDEVLERLEDGVIDVATAAQQLHQVAAAAPPFSACLTTIACAILCGTIAVFFGGNLIEVCLATILGLFIALLELVHAKLGGERGMLEPLAGFAAAISSLSIAHWFAPHDDRLVTLAALIVILPGLQLTISLTELAVGHLSAGVARLAGACVSLLTLTVGVAIAWRIGEPLRNVPATPQWVISEGWQWLALMLAPITFSILFRARLAQWPVIIVVSISGFLVSRYAGVYGIEVGAFFGALVVGCLANLYARVRNRPAMVPLTPGIIMLVPGSVGYRSLTAMLDHQTIEGIDFAFSMMILGVSIVGGVLTANAVMPPKRIL
jgi:uncharacterized membrane protein YjjP (DUF1212 family)